MSTVTKSVKQANPPPEPSVDLYELAETLPAEQFAAHKLVREFIGRKVALDRMNRTIQRRSIQEPGEIRVQYPTCIHCRLGDADENCNCD
jgi:hypothetical protein